MMLFCQNKNRRDLVLQTPSLNGIDYLEVIGTAGCGNATGADLPEERQQPGADRREHTTDRRHHFDHHQHPARYRRRSVDDYD